MRFHYETSGVGDNGRDTSRLARESRVSAVASNLDALEGGTQARHRDDRMISESSCFASFAGSAVELMEKCTE